MFSPSESLTQLQAHHSVRAASQNPAVLRCDFLFRRAHRLIVDGDAALAREPAGFALAAGEPGIDKELRDRPFTRHHGHLLGLGASKRAALVAVRIRRGIRVELADETLGQALLDISRFLTIAKGARLIRNLGR